MSKEKHTKKFNRGYFVISLVMLIIVTNCSSFIFGNYIASKGMFFTKVSNEVEKSIKTVKDTKKYESLFDVRETILKKYDGKINDDKLLEGAIKGMTNALGDPYTVYYNKQEFFQLLSRSKASMEVLGVQIALIKDNIMIVGCKKDSPGDRAGLKSGDIILKINDTTYTAEQYDDVLDYLTSENNKQFKFTIQREEKNIFDVNIKKEIIKNKAIDGEMVSSDVGYVRIYTFMNEEASVDFRKKVDELKSKGMKGLILDLRNNGGGLLSQAVGIVSQFIPKGKIITYTIDKYGNRKDSLSTGGELESFPLVILVNSGSASASEVVTGALRDYDVAKIVGETTFGKGIVQQPYVLDEAKGGLKITISKYYTPKGENIHNIGIKPEFEVAANENIDDNQYMKSNDEQLNFAKIKIKEYM